MTLSAWWLLAIAVPVILLGEQLVRRVGVLARFSIPVPVAGGLVVAVAVLLLNLGGVELTLGTRTAAAWWTWLPSTELEWRGRPALPIVQPLMVAFFTCIGLNASWSLVRRGGWPLVRLLAIATGLALLQNALGVGLAYALGFAPLLGLMCSSVTLTGGPGTAMGFATEFERAGLAGAGEIGAAAAMFGIVAASLVGGPVATLRIRQLRSRTPPADAVPVAMPAGAPVPLEYETPLAPPPTDGFVAKVASLARLGSPAVVHLLILVACIKAGAWLSLGLRTIGLTFPVYMGAMLCGIAVRNALDALGRPVVRTATVELLSSVILAVFLSIAMASLNLAQLAATAGPMLVVLVAQVGLMIAFAWLVTFNLMGRDYEAAVATGGHVGFGLGVTPNAVANMSALTGRFGAAPRAFLVVTIVGAFLIDFTNALAVTAFLHLLR